MWIYSHVRTCRYIKCCWDDLYARHRMVRRTCECCYSEVGPWTMAVPQHHRLSVLIQQCFLNMCCFILCFRNFSWVDVVFQRSHLAVCFSRDNQLAFVCMLPDCCPHIISHSWCFLRFSFFFSCHTNRIHTETGPFNLLAVLHVIYSRNVN